MMAEITKIIDEDTKEKNEELAKQIFSNPSWNLNAADLMNQISQIQNRLISLQTRMEDQNRRIMDALSLLSSRLR